MGGLQEVDSIVMSLRADQRAEEQVYRLSSPRPYEENV